MSSERWIETNEIEDVAGSVRHALLCAAHVDKDDQAWKWAFLALHSALQGACVVYLTTTASPVGAVTKKNAAEWLKYFEESRTNSQISPPKTQLMNLPDLLKAVRKPSSAGKPICGIKNTILISDSELSWLTRLHDEIRNQFAHFEPQQWAIEISGIPNAAKLIARIINEILDHGYISGLSDEVRNKLRTDLKLLSEASWYLDDPSAP